MLKAYILGLPTKLSQYLFRTVMALVLLVFFAPAFVALVNRIRKRSEKCRKQRLSLFYRCLSVLLAYIMLITPSGFQTIAQAESQYANIETFNWAEGNQTVEYTYDDNGSVLTKITKVASTQAVIEKVEYDYNLQNRLEKQTVKDAGDVVQSWTEYTYNEDGIRVKSVHFDGTNTTTTLYLIDAYNHTGYAQTIEESTYDMANPDPTTDIPASIMFYTIGDDIISQTKAEYDSGWTVYDTEHFLYDGHGTTRQLSIYDATPGVEKAVVTDVYNYDAYGVAVGFDPSASPTSLLYAGEYYDSDLSQYYLRARWYDQNTGRFNRMDPFAGSNRDPQSLHKYLYVHCNPVNGIDPTGETFLGTVSAISIRVSFMAMNLALRCAPAIHFATTVAGAAMIASGIQLVLEQAGFVPQTGYTEEIFAISAVVFTAGLTLSMFIESFRGIVEPVRNSSGGQIINGKTANARYLANNPGHHKPYKPFSLAAKGKIAPSADLVRVHHSGNKIGNWAMPRSEIQGLNAHQVQDKFSLTYTPSYISNVKATGVDACSGIAAKIPGSVGGGIQIELPQDLTNVTFTNTTPFP